MPSTSKKQHNFMEAIAHNKAFAKKVHIPQKVGEDFVNADKGKKFKEGGTMKHEKKMASGGMNPMAAAMMMKAARKPRAAAPAAMPAAPMGGMGMKHGGKAHHEDHHHHMKMAHHHLKMAMKAGGKTMEKAEPHSKDMGEKMLKRGGKAHHYAGGGHISEQRMEPSHMEKGHDLSRGNKKFGEHPVQEKGHTRGMNPSMKGNTIGTGPLVNTKKRGGKIC
jgi:hypothetical protein